METEKRVKLISKDKDLKKEVKKLQGIFLGEEYPVADEYDEYEDKIVLHAKSTFIRIIVDGKVADRIHAKATRTFEIAPIRNKRTYVELEYSRFKNPSSEGPKTIPENLPFINPYKRRTKDLDAAIVCASIFLSLNSAETMLKGIGIFVSRSTIRRTVMIITFCGDKCVVVIGVDDASIRKGCKYVTVIYDAETGDCLAVLMGRDGSAFEAWLQEHPNVKVVARDRASGYAKAVRKVNPSIIQVADRFHLFQNLNDYIKKALQKILPKELFIKVSDGSVLDKAPAYETALSQPNKERLAQYNFDTSEPKDECGNPIVFDRTHRDKNTREYRKALKRTAKKRALIENVRKYAQEHPERGSRKELCKKFNITQSTALRYIRMSEKDIEKATTPSGRVTHNTEWDKYINVIYKMHAAKIDPEDIFFYVLEMPGFTLNQRVLANYVDVIGRNNFIGRRSFRLISITNFKMPDGIVRFTRDDIIKFVTTVNPKTKKNPEVEKYITAIGEKYSDVNEAMEIAKEFHAIIMGEVNTPIEDFLVRNESSMIASLCRGIWADLDAVKNAIELPYNSGFVEGSNNLLKLTERTSFGRLGLENLERKFKLRTQAEKLTARKISKMLFEELGTDESEQFVPNYDALPFEFG